MAVADTAWARQAAEAIDGVVALAAGPMRASLRPADGGRVAALWREDPKGRRIDVLTPMPPEPFAPTQWPKAGLYPLVPFSNRVRGATFTHAGQQVRLMPHPGSEPHAQHGFCQRHPWRVGAVTAHSATLHFAHEPEGSEEGWPWAFTARQVLSLDGAGLTHEIALTNLSASAMPAGLGLHPFFAFAPGDRVRFTLEAVWDQDAEGLPTRLVPLAGSDRLFEIAQSEATRTLFGAGFGGIAAIERRDGARVVVETGAPLEHLVVHVPPGGGSCCIEPVSHVADAFNLAAAGLDGTGLRVIAPGETLHATVRIGLA